MLATTSDSIDSIEILSLRENVKNQLLQIRTVDDGITYLNKLKSIEVWVRAEKKDAELQNIVAEQKLRTQRILGGLIQDGQRKGEIKTQATAKSNTITELDEIGITRKQSSTFQSIASIPEDDFEEFIQEKKEAVNEAVSELTTAGAVRLAKTLKETKQVPKNESPVIIDYPWQEEVKELASYINKNFNVEQKSYLIDLIK